MPKKHYRPQANPLAGPDAIDPEKQFYSVGFVCAMIQQPPLFVIELMQRAGVEFDHCRDGIGQLRGDHVQRMAAVLADERERCEAAASN